MQSSRGRVSRPEKLGHSKVTGKRAMGRYRGRETRPLQEENKKPSGTIRQVSGGITRLKFIIIRKMFHNIFNIAIKDIT